MDTQEEDYKYTVSEEEVEAAYQRSIELEKTAKHVTSYIVSVKQGCLHVALMWGIDCIGCAEFDPVSKWVTVTRYVATDWPDKTGIRHRIDYQVPDGESVLTGIHLCAHHTNNMRLDDFMQHRETITEIVESMTE